MGQMCVLIPIQNPALHLPLLKYDNVDQQQADGSLLGWMIHCWELTPERRAFLYGENEEEGRLVLFEPPKGSTFQIPATAELSSLLGTFSFGFFYLV